MLLSFVFLSLSILSTSLAYNYLDDGDFEAPDDSEFWTYSGQILYGYGTDNSYAWTASSSRPTEPDTISQLVKGLTPGTGVTLSFCAYTNAPDYGDTNLLTVAFGSFKRDITKSLTDECTTFSYPITPSASSLTLTFTGYSVSGLMVVDDVHVENIQQPSGIPALKKKREATKRYQQLLKAHPLCPTAFTPCPVFSANGTREPGFECIDTLVELNSCGGCLGNGGTDCEHVNGIKSATCEAGSCRALKCQVGWKLRDGECV